MQKFIEDTAISYALQARAQFNIHPLEPIDIFKEVYPFANIICLKEPLPDDISGMYTNVDGIKVVIINTAKTVGHQNFTAAHELYHAIFESSKDQLCKTGTFDFSNESEATADLFSAFFLMPEEAIRYHLGKKMGDRKTIELDDVIYLEQIFHTSHISMLRRLRELRIIKKSKMNEFMPKIRQQALLLGYSDSLYRPSNNSELISDYITKVAKAYKKDLISYSRYLELMADVGHSIEDVEGVEDYVD